MHHVLNECLVDRGASPAMVTLQVSADRHHITTVQVRGPAQQPPPHRNKHVFQGYSTMPQWN